jgi:hypothetical protein
VTDTGPPYPAPDPTSNEIGKFTIAVSPIGTISPFDVWTTIISQFANSPILTQVITDFATGIDQTANFDNFYDNIMNVDTAYGYGLDVWGRIVGVNRIITVFTALPYFGFEESNEAVGFNQAPFFSGQTVTNNFILDDVAYRRLIIAKAFANITRCSTPNLNAMLMMMFPGRGGNAYVVEGAVFGPYFGFEEAGDAVGFNQAPFYSGEAISRMVITYTFQFALTDLDLAIVQSSGVLPKPTGVLAYVAVI